MEVIAVVAAADNTLPAELPPLYEAIDLNALDDLIDAGIDWLSFSYVGYAIAIDAQGEITANLT